ncbi:MAG: AlpA family phage regulatory protein [bacterium]|nr:AlpA family phage regulatory protein [bacterium]
MSHSGGYGYRYSRPQRRSVDPSAGGGALLSASSIHRFMRSGLFPEPIRAGRCAVRWHDSEIDAWLAARSRATGDQSVA